jgi:hypothetical protein
MAMTIFLVLNSLGVVFLLYVLANFWREGHRPKNIARKYAAEFGGRDWADAVVGTHPISRSAQSGLSVIPFQAQERELDGKPAHRPAAREAMEIPARRFSTR